MNQSRFQAPSQSQAPQPTPNITEEKLLMFLNEPIFFQIYQKTQDLTGKNMQFALKKIMADQKVIRRYRVLQQAKDLMIEDRKVDTNIDFLLTHLQSIQQHSANEIIQTQNQKQELIQKFKDMQGREKDLKRQFDNIKIKLDDSTQKFSTLTDLKKTVDKIVEKTQIIRALTLSNKSLKEQNGKLNQKLQDSQKTVQRLMAEIRHLRESK